MKMSAPTSLWCYCSYAVKWNAGKVYSALSLSIIFEEKEVKRGPGFWKFNNSLLTDKDYTELISQNIPEFVSKYREVTDKGLLWEMIKMEIRAATILFSKRKARQKRDEEKKSY